MDGGRSEPKSNTTHTHTPTPCQNCTCRTGQGMHVGGRHAVQQHVPRPRHSLLPVQSTTRGNRPAGPGYARDLTTSRLRQIQWSHLAWPSFVAPSSPLAIPVNKGVHQLHHSRPVVRPPSCFFPRNSGLFSFPHGRILLCLPPLKGIRGSLRVKPGRKKRSFFVDHPRSTRNICILPSGLPADLPQSWLALMPDWGPRHSSLSLPPPWSSSRLAVRAVKRK
ncbi:hypothetical protein IWX90DRAFT_295525 [Phyllosticta citrichinensis]|uniref:Uncharacterized protein n=1 Tax=Phyllosticta citrichinensis TaxID=1130410 RepID=A0ABR1XKK9_9PEZI